MSQPNPYILAADNPSAVLALLRSNPSIASNQDEHGYSLLHAAASYGHIDLLRALVEEFNVNVNLLDEDGETCLFVAENVNIAKCLVEELNIDYNKTNDEGLTARETIESDGSFPEVAAYLREVAGVSGDVEGNGNLSVGDALNPAPPLPPNIQVNLGTMSEQEANGGIGEVDPEFKRRIDELAAREDFQSEASQNELRQLVLDAIQGSNIETQNKDQHYWLREATSSSLNSRVPVSRQTAGQIDLADVFHTEAASTAALRARQTLAISSFRTRHQATPSSRFPSTIVLTLSAFSRPQASLQPTAAPPVASRANGSPLSGSRRTSAFRRLREKNHDFWSDLTRDLYMVLTTTTGCAESASALECLRALPIESLSAALNISNTPVFSGTGLVPWLTQVDGEFLLDGPTESLDKQHFVPVSIMNTTGTDEPTAFGFVNSVDTNSDFRNYIAAGGPRQDDHFRE
ncbi:hypothetical protein BDW68DRAFT_175714 [Aspergillus falconensis]